MMAVEAAPILQRFGRGRMVTRSRLILVALALVLALPGLASAGMPSVTLADVGRVLAPSNLTRMRLEAISFFAVGLLACAGMIQGIWNSLRTDFAILPRLSFGKALGLVVLWGLLFVLVLTMISGARELMTPGAWEKTGLTSQLAQDTPTPVERQITERHRALERLRDALWRYAEGHGKRFPPPEATGAIPEDLWTAPASGGQRYIYMGGPFPEEDAYLGAPLAYEPEAFGPDRLVLLVDGTILWMPMAEIERALAGEGS